MSDKLKSEVGPLIVVKKEPTEEDLAIWLSTVPGFIEGLTETDFEPTKLYDYQVDYLNDKSSFRHINKSRQTGFSYVFAAEGTAKAHLNHKYTQIYISINQEEANNKIVYARNLYDSMPLSFRKKLITDNRMMLEFEGNCGNKKSRTQIISHAQREPRGKGGNTHIVLDEAAHYMYGDKIFNAAIPITTRGNGGLVIASTPLGKTGVHWRLSHEPEFKNVYSFYNIHWWNCKDFVRDGLFEKAQIYAPKVITQERVERYANDKIRIIFAGMDLEYFQQEYECHHIDESVSYFPISLLNKCAFNSEDKKSYNFEVDDYKSEIIKTNIEEKYPDIKFCFYYNTDELIGDEEIIKGRLIAGFDVGRKANTAELFILEELNGILILRCRRSFDNIDFETMESEIKYAVEKLNISKLAIDSTGMGIQIGERLVKKFPSVCYGINFTNKWKEEASSNVRRLLESQKLAIPNDREIICQMHSIKRIISSFGNIRFDTESTSKHHADCYWAIALACTFYEESSYIDYSYLKSDNNKLKDKVSIKIPRPTSRIFQGNKFNISNSFGLQAPNFRRF